MRFYNLCDEKENELFRVNNPHAFGVRDHDDMCNEFLYYYVDDSCVAARLDGPAFQYKDNSTKRFLINYGYVSEYDYWKHPDVIAYRYLQEHPELEGFI